MITTESQLKKYRACMATIGQCASDVDCEACDLHVPDAQIKLFRELDRLVGADNV